MNFNNRPNECIKTDDGRELWISRSVAVAVSVLLVKADTPYILVNQRGPGVPDAQYLWNLPCGYLDYDESTEEAAVREVWEECGINLLELSPSAACVYLEKPWDVSSKPGGAKQNVTIHHGLVAMVDELPAVSAENNEPNETVDIRWLPLSEACTLDFAFNHLGRIETWLEFLASEHQLDFCSHFLNRA